ncbi:MULTISPECIES: response regulator [unclassified Fusibacter]|uniref:response regulator n=1 Tax=unclassified Fusibacter TaxID=2624464 RepID=UPI0010126385|nr:MULTISPECIES: response regulator [unclassified Fusibacter]MCK8059500.1 response regulator [Fusibacter sp. A2]NPE21036.1 response regulator [Fusibacter sp. A1]RXV62310.1 response regulator [Fusibacter sp. A1]
MYSIGQISKLVNLSTDALRYYDEINLLNPSYVNKKSNYRYYSKDQIQQLLSIIELKHLGFSLDAIKQLMDCTDPKALESAYRLKMNQMTNDIKEMHQLADRLNKKLSNVTGSVEPVTVLLIDDSDFMRFMQKDILEKNGYKVVAEAADAMDGIAAFLKHAPDLVLMDIDMPKMDGITALKRLIEIDSTCRVVMCAACSTLQTVVDSLSLGATGFIAKAFHVDDFLNTIDVSMKGEFDTSRHMLTTLSYDKTFMKKHSYRICTQHEIDRIARSHHSYQANDSANLIRTSSGTPLNAWSIL